jgi:hypothetical protein
MKTKTTLERIIVTKAWFFEKISKTDKALAKLTKKKEEEDLQK